MNHQERIESVFHKYTRQQPKFELFPTVWPLCPIHARLEPPSSTPKSVLTSCLVNKPENSTPMRQLGRGHLGINRLGGGVFHLYFSVLGKKQMAAKASIRGVCLEKQLLRGGFGNSAQSHNYQQCEAVFRMMTLTCYKYNIA